MAEQFEFETQRLLIKPWTGKDRAALERMAFDKEMMRHVTRGRVLKAEDVDAFLALQEKHLSEHGICFGAVVRKANGEVVGLAGMQPHDDGRFELGWWVWRAYWGSGYALEAIRPFVAHARDTMRLPEVVAVIDPDNRASKRVAEKLGMRYKCTISAQQTIAVREDRPIDYFILSLAEPTGPDSPSEHRVAS